MWPRRTRSSAAQDDATALTFAAYKGHTAIVTLLLERGVDKSVKHMARSALDTRALAASAREALRAVHLASMRAVRCAPPGLL
jgi:ankyrin repeat protein